MRDPNRAQVRTFLSSSGSSCTALQTVGRPWSSRSATCTVGRGPGEIHKEATELCNHSLTELSGNSRSYTCFFCPTSPSRFTATEDPQWASDTSGTRAYCVRGFTSTPS
uniref:Uncharacterized protein n=1 Tax=Magnusiomyces tetraspermus TaxID=1232584 RepID=A0A023UPN8_9ASCO|nr:hypothetical protein [Magnusiomyces tetraspermus]AHY04932.1 hypothetical protein [Magnusiomyces tetraspermus]